MKKLLSILATLGITASTVSTVVAWSPNSKLETKTELKEVENNIDLTNVKLNSQDISELLEGLLDLGYVSTTKEAVGMVQANINAIPQLKDHVILGEPKDGKIHISPADETLVGSADFIYQLKEDINVWLKGKLNLGYVDSVVQAVAKAQKIINEIPELKDKVILNVQETGKIHVTPKVPNLVGSADFLYQLKGENINVWLQGKLDLGPVNNEQDAKIKAQLIINGIPELKLKVILGEPKNNKIHVKPADEFLTGEADFTFSIIPELKNLFEQTYLGEIDNLDEVTVLNVITTKNPKTEGKIKVKENSLTVTSVMVEALNSKEYQGLVEIVFNYPELGIVKEINNVHYILADFYFFNQPASSIIDLINPSYIKKELNKENQKNFKDELFSLNDVINTETNQPLNNTDLASYQKINARINFNYSEFTNQSTELLILIGLMPLPYSDVVSPNRKSFLEMLKKYISSSNAWIDYLNSVIFDIKVGIILGWMNTGIPELEFEEKICLWLKLYIIGDLKTYDIYNNVKNLEVIFNSFKLIKKEHKMIFSGKFNFELLVNNKKIPINYNFENIDFYYHIYF